MIDTGLHNRIAIITGANHGIGAATAKALAAQGAGVLITYLKLSGASDAIPDLYHAARATGATAVVEAIRVAGGRAEALEADLSDPHAIPQLFDYAEATLGPADILVHNAAYWEADTLLAPGIDPDAPGLWPPASAWISPESHDRHFAVNSRAAALLIAEFARRVATRSTHWGRIITVSTDGSPGFASEVSYGASKSALESYSRAAALELGRLGITANIVSPGPIQTGWIADPLGEQIAAKTPLRRVGMPEDVADVIVFLASEQARWLTGQLLFVGGGHRMV